MKTMPKRRLEDTLTNGPLTVKQLCLGSGYRLEKTDEVFDFYILLGEAIRSNRIAVDGDVLKLTEAR